MKEKKILIIMGGMGRDGAERVISLISDYFCTKGWKVYIALLLFNKVGYKLNENITILDLTFGDGSRVRRIPMWLKGIRKIVKEIEPDEILSFVARINVLSQLACFGLDYPIVVSERNDPYMDGRGKIVDILTNLLYPKAKTVIFQTKRAAGYFRKIELKNSVIIPNPIAVRCFAQNESKHKIVSVGRLAEQKNHKMLIEAFSEVVKNHPDYELWIYGEGNLRDELGTIISEHHLEGKIFLPGNIPDIHERIADAEMFVLSSDYEGLSNALLEAMMMGLPCISTNCAGSDEYIKDGVNGLLVPVGDKEKMARAIERLIEDDVLRTNIGKAGKKSVEQCDSQIVIKKWCETIEG